MPEPMPMPMPMAHAHADLEHADYYSDEEDHVMAPHSVAAPVSRGEHYAMSGELEPHTGRITLTPQQREIANLPGGPGETEYAKQLLRMNQMKKSGLIK